MKPLLSDFLSVNIFTVNSYKTGVNGILIYHFRKNPLNIKYKRILNVKRRQQITKNSISMTHWSTTVPVTHGTWSGWWEFSEKNYGKELNRFQLAKSGLWAHTNFTQIIPGLVAGADFCWSPKFKYTLITATSAIKHRDTGDSWLHLISTMKKRHATMVIKHNGHHLTYAVV